MPAATRKPAAPPSRRKPRGKAAPPPLRKGQMTPEQALLARTSLQLIVDKIANNARIARTCGVKHQAIQGWLTRGFAPDDHVATLSNLAGEFGLVIPPWNLRPDKITPELIACIRAHSS